MARTVGEGKEVKKLAKSLQDCLEEIIKLNGKSVEMLTQLAQTSKDRSYQTAEKVVNEVTYIIKAGLPECAETANKVSAYGDFLISMEND